MKNCSLLFAVFLSTFVGASPAEAKNLYAKWDPPQLSNPIVLDLNNRPSWFKNYEVPNGRDVVIIGNNPEGQVTHYLLGPFGETIWGPLRRERKIPQKVNRLIVYTEYADLASRAWFGGPAKAMFLQKWDDVLQVLQEAHGKDAKVVVYPNAEIQYCR